jgi:hypothetical protein
MCDQIWTYVVFRPPGQRPGRATGSVPAGRALTRSANLERLPD